MTHPHYRRSLDHPPAARRRGRGCVCSACRTRGAAQSASAAGPTRCRRRWRCARCSCPGARTASPRSALRPAGARWWRRWRTRSIPCWTAAVRALRAQQRRADRVRAGAHAAGARAAGAGAPVRLRPPRAGPARLHAAHPPPSRAPSSWRSCGAGRAAGRSSWSTGSCLSLLLPTLRADVAIHETYDVPEQAPLACPITAYGGVADPKVTPRAAGGVGPPHRGPVRAAHVSRRPLLPAGRPRPPAAHPFRRPARTCLVGCLQHLKCGVMRAGRGDPASGSARPTPWPPPACHAPCAIASLIRTLHSPLRYGASACIKQARPLSSTSYGPAWYRLPPVT